MREATTISELRAALRRRGVWGARAERLLQEWTEHVRDDAARRVEHGAETTAAEEAAWQALGSADVLAVSASRELARASWLGRHPWLGGLALPVLGWIVAIIAMVGIPLTIAFFLGWADAPDPAKFFPAFQCWAQMINWLPWLFAMAWLAWIAARMPGGWKLYWITAVVLTLCAPAVKLNVQPPSHVPHSGVIFLSFYDGIPFLISSAIQNALLHMPYIGPWFQDWVDAWLNAHQPLTLAPQTPQTVALIQTAILGLGAIVFYLKAAGRRKAISAAVVAGWLLVCWAMWGPRGLVL